LIIAGDETGSLGLVLTLEGLIMGVTGKKLLWRALAAANLPQLNDYDFEELQRHADNRLGESKPNGYGQFARRLQERVAHSEIS
jgi:hypothetical protein